jgi:phytoene synthase
LTALEESYRHCAAITRAAAKNFYYTFLLLPPAKRRAIHAVYTFSRQVDDIVDGAASRADAALCEAGLSRMKALLDAATASDNPLAPALRDTIQEYGIPVAHFHELIEGMKMDLTRKRYRDFSDLRIYCYRAASTIGLISIRIFGFDGEPAAVEQPAIDMGLAMQLTNIIRDVGEDLARDRIYLPQDEMQRFGVSEEDLRRLRNSEPIRELLSFQVERAREHFRRAEPLFSQLHADARYCPVLLKRFYSEILDQVEERRYDVFTRRPRLSALRKLTLAGSAWLKARCLLWPS